jgi:hypothetical protein
MQMNDRLHRVETQINPVALENETLGFLLAYWNGKRGARAMPSRGDIKASELKEHLGWVMLVEVLPGITDFRYRLMGTLVTQYFFKDSTGKTVKEIYDGYNEAAGKGVSAIFRKCARDKAIVHARGDSGWIGEGYEPFECICLPLSDDGETVNMILHAFVFDKSSVMMAREIARANGGEIIAVPPTRADA